MLLLLLLLLLCVYQCVRVCVREREREGGGGGYKGITDHGSTGKACFDGISVYPLEGRWRTTSPGLTSEGHEDNTPRICPELTAIRMQTEGEGDHRPPPDLPIHLGTYYAVVHHFHPTGPAHL